MLDCYRRIHCYTYRISAYDVVVKTVFLLYNVRCGCWYSLCLYIVLFYL